MHFLDDVSFRDNDETLIRVERTRKTRSVDKCFAYLGAGRAESRRGIKDKTERRNEERLIVREESDS